MRSCKKILLSLFVGLSLLSGAAYSQEVVLETIKTFPVAKELLKVSGEPVAVIETGIITDENGLPARGPHDIEFRLDAGSKYPVIVDGVEVQPGASVVINKNLTTTGHVLTIPIYPSVSGIEDSATYTMTLPVIRTQVCLEGTTEVEDGCLTITTTDLVIDCPATYQSDTSNGITCFNYTTTPIILECEMGYGLEAGECVRRTILTAGYNCNAYPGANLNGSDCVQYEVKPVSQCLAGWDVYGGQCRQTTTTNASLGCPSGYSVSGSSCTRLSSKTPSEGCSSGLHKNPESISNGTWTYSCIKYEGSYECVDGMHRTPEGDCTISTRHKVDGVCPSGYPYERVLNNGTYIMCSDEPTLPIYTTNAPYKYCPGNGTFKYPSDDNCYDYANKQPTIPTCDSGYTYNSSNNKCTTTVTTSKVYTCNVGTVSGSQCLIYSYEPQGTYCFSGGDYNPVTNQCEIDINMPADRHCDADFNMESDGENCKKVEQYTFKNCDDPTYIPDSGMSKCERTLLEQPTLICEAGFEVNEADLTCVKTIKTDFSW